MSTNDNYNSEFFDSLRAEIDDWEAVAADYGFISVGSGATSIQNVLMIAAEHLYDTELNHMYRLARRKTKSLERNENDPLGE